MKVTTTMTTPATTTRPTTTPAAAAAPRPSAEPFDRIEGEGWHALGQRALLCVLRDEWATWRLDDEALEACADGARVAATARGLAPQVAETLAALERRLRGLLTGRRANAAAEAALTLGQPSDAPQAPQTASNGPSQGGGGSKVPRRPKPQGPAPADALRLPTVPVPQARPTVPVRQTMPGPALQPLAASSLAVDELF